VRGRAISACRRWASNESSILKLHRVDLNGITIAEIGGAHWGLQLLPDQRAGFMASAEESLSH